MTHVSWIPAHPVYGSVSMLRYWKLLAAAIRSGDGFSCSSILSATAEDLAHHGGKVGKVLTRQLIYPAMVKLRAKGEIVHILDHSWADMLPFTPRQALKIVTVHDLIPLRFPGELSAAQAGRFRSWVSHLKEADAIIAVSEYTKREVADLLAIDSGKIHVVFNGVEMPPDSPAPVPSPPDLARELRIGSIGSTLERKNLAILPEAFSRFIARTGRRISLVRVGEPLPTELADELRRVLGPAGLVERGRLSDAELGDFYRSMDVVVVPSLYEGFGLPVLEAMAWGIPVISSNAASLPEVGGDDALYFDPYAPSELATRLEELALNGMPAGWRERVLARASALSWRASLEGVYSVYHRALELRSSAKNRVG